MKLDLALFVSSKKAASLGISSNGKTYDIVLSLCPEEGKEAVVIEVYRTSTDGGVTHRRPNAHDVRHVTTMKERLDLLKMLGVREDEWEPEEDGRA